MVLPSNPQYEANRRQLAARPPANPAGKSMAFRSKLKVRVKKASKLFRGRPKRRQMRRAKSRARR